MYFMKQRSQLLDNIGDSSSREKRQLLFQEIDVDNSGLLDFDEFLTLMDILAGSLTQFIICYSSFFWSYLINVFIILFCNSNNI